MKKRSFSIAAFVLFISLFSSAAFAQDDSGGSSGGSDGGPDGHPISQPSPVSFKRNNGNGTCGGQAEIRVAFNLIPDYSPTMQEIMYEGRRIPVNIHPVDPSLLIKKGYVSYCVSNTNVPPAKKLAIKFTYIGSNQTFWLMETDSF